MSFFKKWLGNPTDLKSHAEIAAMLHQAVQDAGMDCGVPELGATANDTYLPLASGRVAVGHFYRLYAQAPEQLDALVAEFVRLNAAAPPPLPLQAEQVMPMVRNVAWLQDLYQTLSEAGEAENWRKHVLAVRLEGDLLLTFVQDNGDKIRTLGEADLHALNLADMSALYELALDNLLRRAEQKIDIKGGNGRYRVRLDGVFDAALITLADALAEQMQFRGHPVFALPSRNELFVGDSADVEVMAQLQALAAKRYAAAAFNISRKLYVLENDGLAEWGV